LAWRPSKWKQTVDFVGIYMQWQRGSVDSSVGNWKVQVQHVNSSYVKEKRNQELACIQGKQGYAYLRDYPGRTHEFKLVYWQYSLRMYTCRLLEVRYNVYMRGTYLQPANRKRMVEMSPTPPRAKNQIGLPCHLGNIGPIHLAYNPSYSACFFSRNSIFLS
jgi:hypothetical protein